MDGNLEKKALSIVRRSGKSIIGSIGDKIYYPKGVTDPDYCVLKFTAEIGRVYENQSSASFEID